MHFISPLAHCLIASFLICGAGPPQHRHAADLLDVLFRRKLDLHQTTFAMGEAIAHLHALWFDGRLQRQQDADGVYRFVAAA